MPYAARTSRDVWPYHVEETTPSRAVRIVAKCRTNDGAKRIAAALGAHSQHIASQREAMKTATKGPYDPARDGYDSWRLACVEIAAKIAERRMEISPAGLALIRKHEGCSLERYLDAAGIPSIGTGHRIKPGEHFERITEQENERLLRADLWEAEHAVTMLVTVPLTQPQFDALVSFTFNVGSDIDDDTDAEGLGDSTLLKLLNAGDSLGACAEFPKWHYCQGRRLKGLLRRRLAEAALFLNDE